VLVEQLKRVRYSHKQAVWLAERFPTASCATWKAWSNWWTGPSWKPMTTASLPAATSGGAGGRRRRLRFRGDLREIHVELEGLNAEAAELAARISRNFKELGI